MVDAMDSKSIFRKEVRVRVSPAVPQKGSPKGGPFCGTKPGDSNKGWGRETVRSSVEESRV